MTQTVIGNARVCNVNDIDADHIVLGKHTKTLDTSDLASRVLEDLGPCLL